MAKFRIPLQAILVVVALVSCNAQPVSEVLPESRSVIPTEFIKGFDASEARAAESKGVAFKDTNGAVKPALQIFKDHSFNWVRLRIMVDPDGNYALNQDLAYVKAMALDAKNRGLKILLDFHYSHWWADPGNQWIPARWSGQNLATLTTSVYNYTKDVMTQLKNQGSPPAMVQIGNEINGGVLWEVGRSSNMANFVQLTNAGANAVRDASGGTATTPAIMVHIAKTGNAAQTVAWYQAYKNAGGWIDTIGLSYYPMWHGNFSNLSGTISSLRSSFNWAKVYVVETAYYWSTNQKGYTGLPYPQTPQGQYDYLKALKPVVVNAGGSGIFYWGANWSQSSKWLNAPGWTDDDSSRRALFDDTAKATKGIDGLN
jgi:arabinogalactan endo-1,4-beta-galactosidase